MPQPKVLVVDDTPEVRSLLGRILVGQGYEVLEACDALQALEECSKINGEIDLLLTDIKMPGMDGIELAAKVTAAYPAIHVLYISGQCEEDTIQTHVLKKRFGFLSKPFLPHKLIQAVEEVLAPGKQPGRADSLDSHSQDPTKKTA